VLRGIASRLTPAIVQICRDDAVVFSGKFSAPLELGRQKQADSPLYTPVPREAGERVAMAPADDRMVSRTHLSLDVVAKNEFLVANRSSKLNLFLNGEYRLPPGESQYSELPLTILVGPVTVQLVDQSALAPG
jgi:hypothetical protein